MLTKRSLTALLIAALISALFPLITAASVHGSDAAVRPDVLVIDQPNVPGQKEMPAVQFKHDLHTKALDGQCAKCHDAKDGKTVFEFKQAGNLAGEARMTFYHDNCVACHKETKGPSGDEGPTEAQCRTCHNADRPIGSSWEKIKFNRALHVAHERAKAIPSRIGTESTNCNACHHSADMKAKKAFYEKGKESACAYCHIPAEGREGANGIRSARAASHDACVACHLSLKEKKVAAGPVDCGGCHTQAAQAKIKPVQGNDLPRFDRNQPDQALLTGWNDLGYDRTENQRTIARHMNAVPFDHKRHEVANASCKICHHKSLEKCATCHTAEGSDKGGQVRLSDAMHRIESVQSCVGCHNERQAARECAGCHAQMPRKKIRDQNCAACHSVDVKACPPPMLKDETARRMVAQKALSEDKPYEKITPADIPETVIIKDLENEYKPANFPHRLVVESIFKKIEGNGLARAFHGSDLTLCSGCHHNGPVTRTPPQCASCHASRPDIAAGKPGLKGAFHGQCITCHQKMDVKNVSATDCFKCHEKK